jgi:hypothetical protein
VVAFVHYDAKLVAAERCAKAGYPFGLPISNCGGANAWVGVMFDSFGAELVDAEGNITVRSDEVRQALRLGGSGADGSRKDERTGCC